MNRTTALLFLLLGTLLTAMPHPARAWAPKQGPLSTPWTTQVSRIHPWPEYPRPQLVRTNWLNLNGIWQYQSGAAGDPVPVGKRLSGGIRVPFPVESALSGVMEHHDRLWYRRAFTVPPAWKGKRVLLHFEAVDYEAQIFVNGKSVGIHTGGYEAFQYDVTDYLKGSGPQELIVRVYDPTDLGGQPRGKQTLHPGGIMYTSTTGIWQTVWMEPVSRTAIQDLKIVPDVDNRRIKLTVTTFAPAPDAKVTIKILAAGAVVQTVTARPNVLLNIPIIKPRLWSPNSPFLYNLDVTLTQNKAATDHVVSYFGMRKISLGKVGGVTKMLLNNKFVFEIGPLDQGFWPDGIYTPPTDTAMKADLQAMKTLGFNMVRKHIKVESARWYYWADKLGLMVWQDMPSANSYTDHPQPLDVAAFEKQERQVIQSHWNHPSIIMWIIFNESQGRHDTRRLVALAKTLDPSRLTDRDSGAGYEKGGNGVAGDGDIGNVDDVHSYPPPACPPPSPNQALVCGEYGGIGFLVKGHTWRPTGGGYTEVHTPRELEDLYGEFTNDLKSLRDGHGLSAAVYTQITDVETELNGLMTYDRRFKCNPAMIAKANRFQYPSPTYREVVPTSENAAQTWKYTLDAPGADWIQPGFNDSAWQTGPGGFGASAPAGAPVGTRWTTDDIWLRRTFNPGPLTALQLSRLVVREQHDEDIDVYINGVLAYHAAGYVSAYEYKPVSQAARRSLKPNTENTLAVHCHQTVGGQFIDVGLTERIPARP